MYKSYENPKNPNNRFDQPAVDQAIKQTEKFFFCDVDGAVKSKDFWISFCFFFCWAHEGVCFHLFFFLIYNKIFKKKVKMKES